VRAIADLARAYGLQVVAEGIETAQALEAVDALGCEYGQGFHLGRPAAASVIEAKLGAPLPSDIGLPPVPMSSRAPV
jgi:EAL domain-containing protein (putative c-di-GMP-specific phosphodiesterase class I)